MGDEFIGDPFNINADYPRGTLLGRPYSSVHDQGHVAVLLGRGADAPLLQSYSDCKVEPCPIVVPGVNANRPETVMVGAWVSGGRRWPAWWMQAGWWLWVEGWA